MALVLLTGCGVLSEPAAEETCAEQLTDAEAAVHTTPSDFAGYLPGFGDFLEIRWQLRAPSSACSRAPGPTEYQYQGVIRLRPEDAKALAARYDDWQPLSPLSDEDTEVWAPLQPFLPADVRWLHSDEYDRLPPQTRWRTVFLDPDRALAFFTLNDH